MSQYTRKLPNGYELLYGADKPTGGYFMMVLDENEEVVYEKSGLLMSELAEEVNRNCNIYLSMKDKKELAEDWFSSPPPTALQLGISKFFNVNNLPERINKVNLTSLFYLD